MPSKWEGFGLVAVEAMSVGLPGIFSKTEGLLEVIGENNPAAFSIEKPSPDSIASGIRYFAGIQDQMEILSDYSRNQSEHFSLKDMADNYIDEYFGITTRANSS